MIRSAFSLQKIWLASVAVLFFTSLQAQTTPPQRVLFVGNSYTYFWNLPQQVQAMAQESDLTLQTQQSTIGGANWGQHWRSERELNSVALIKEGPFDAIVLQNHSMRTLEAPDSVMHYGQLFSELVKAQDAQVYIYVTWSRRWDPYMQATITQVYSDLAAQTGATLVPVGPAWERALLLRPELSLYDPDGSHPSPIGAYLSACVFYIAFTGQSPVGLPHRLQSLDQDGEKLYLNILTPGDALFCQKVAEEIWSAYKKQ